MFQVLKAGTAAPAVQRARRGVPLDLQLYYITDRAAFPGDESTRRRCLLEKMAEAARAGVDYIQLREMDLSARDLEFLANQALEVIAETRKPAVHPWPLITALLINSRTDVALATGAAGVHLRSSDVSPTDVRRVWQCGAGAPSAGSGQAPSAGSGQAPSAGSGQAPSAGSGQAPARELLSPNPLQSPVISISCHSPEEVAQAATNGADLAIFGPVFEKKDSPGVPPAGLAQLREACKSKIPVLALGGITLENAGACLNAGAAGIAAIRLFQENDVAALVRTLRC